MKGLYCKLAGSSDVKFFIHETDPPGTLGSHQVKVQVKACALSPLDIPLLQDLKLHQDLVPVGREIAGVVLQVGSKVTFFQPDDEVVGILPLEVEVSGLCDVILIDEHHLVQKPEKVRWEEAAGLIQGGVRVYTALHTLARMATGHTLLLLDGASPCGVLALQLAHHHGVKVLACALSQEDQLFLEQLRPHVGVQECLVARVINLSDGKTDLLEACLEETGGLGVDIVLDSGVRLYGEEHDGQRLLPHKHDIITLLGVGGHWITSEDSLQLDPPDSRSLFLKGASLSFLNEEVWGASRAGQGRFLHIMKDVVEKLSSGTLRPQLEEPVPLHKAAASMEMVQQRKVRKKVVIKL
ncbi:hypothetical protein GJAV_G00254280 [Gymnothorax javanicus]|nr:hypothetical protein GJAV_G00254280 [Gymnothorax javanicus]